MLYTKTHVFFLYSQHEFSNFYKSLYELYDITFYSVEQGYQYEKAIYFNDQETALRILESPNPYDAKRCGRNIKNFDAQSWDKVKHVLMTKHLIQKFVQNPVLKELLLNTGKRVLIEASNKDLIWGCGIRIDDPTLLDLNFPGDNLLGHCLMSIRNRMQQKSII